MPSALTKAPSIGFPQRGHILDNDRQDIRPPNNLHKHIIKDSTHVDACLLEFPGVVGRLESTIAGDGPRCLSP